MITTWREPLSTSVTVPNLPLTLLEDPGGADLLTADTEVVLQEDGSVAGTRSIVTWVTSAYRERSFTSTFRQSAFTSTFREGA